MVSAELHAKVEAMWRGQKLRAEVAEAKIVELEQEMENLKTAIADLMEKHFNYGDAMEKLTTKMEIPS